MACTYRVARDSARPTVSDSYAGVRLLGDFELGAAAGRSVIVPMGYGNPYEGILISFMVERALFGTPGHEPERGPFFVDLSRSEESRRWTARPAAYPSLEGLALVFCMATHSRQRYQHGESRGVLVGNMLTWYGPWFMGLVAQDFQLVFRNRSRQWREVVEYDPAKGTLAVTVTREQESADEYPPTPQGVGDVRLGA